MKRGLVKDQIRPRQGRLECEDQRRKEGWGVGGIRKGFKCSEGEVVMKLECLWFVESGMTWKTGMKGVGMGKTEV